MFNKREPRDRRDGSRDNGDDRIAPNNARARTTTTIGPTLKIKGHVEVTGNEGLHIEGSVEGTMSLRDNILSVGKEGRLKASVDARAIFIRGSVDGDLSGAEQVVIYSSGDVRGDIVAPRVALEDGCRFNGTIDTEVEPSATRTAGKGRNKQDAAELGLTGSAIGDVASAEEPLTV